MINSFSNISNNLTKKKTPPVIITPVTFTGLYNDSSLAINLDASEASTVIRQDIPYTNTVIGWKNYTSSNYSLRTNYNMTRYGLHYESGDTNLKAVICYDPVNKALVCGCKGISTLTNGQSPSLSQTSTSTQEFTTIGCSTELTLGTGGNATFYCVIKAVPAANSSYGGCFSFTNNTTGVNLYGLSGVNNMYIDTLAKSRSGAITIIPAITNKHIYKVVNNAGKSTYSYIPSYIPSTGTNFTTEYTDSVATVIGGTTVPIMVGAGGNSTNGYNNFSGGSIYQILLFTRLLTTVEMDTIERDLCTKWNIV